MTVCAEDQPRLLQSVLAAGRAFVIAMLLQLFAAQLALAVRAQIIHSPVVG